MKVGTLCGLLIFALDVSLFFTPAESFTIPISVSTGMAIIVFLVKIKAIIVKVFLGLRAMGIDGFVWRRRRRRETSLETTDIISQKYASSFHEEFLNIWNDLQLTVGKVIQFDLEACISGAQVSNREKTNLPWERDTFPGYLETDKSHSIKKLSNDSAYSSWVSRTLGSITGDPLACQVVLELSKGKPSAMSTSPDEVKTGENSNRKSPAIDKNTKDNGFAANRVSTDEEVISNSTQLPLPLSSRRQTKRKISSRSR